jgi:hypothetical protein
LTLFPSSTLNTFPLVNSQHLFLSSPRPSSLPPSNRFLSH